MAIIDLNCTKTQALISVSYSSLHISYVSTFIKLYKAGAHVTVNSDNMTLSGVTTHTEINTLMNRMGFTEEDIKKMTEYAIDAAFLSEEEKAELKAKL